MSNIRSPKDPICKLSSVITLFLIFLIVHPLPASSDQHDDLNSRYPIGILMGHSPTTLELYNPETGQVLLLPGVPIPPPTPANDATIIGIIDSGVLSDHPQLQTLITAEKSFFGPNPRDEIGHGTFVALQTIRIRADPAFKELMKYKPTYPKLISARVTTDSAEITVESVLSAIEWVVREGASVVNLSLGFVGDSSDFVELCETISRFSDVLFIAAAGNLGPDQKVFPAHCETDNIMAISEMGNGKLTDTSGLGDVAVPSGARFLTRAQYYLDIGRRNAQGQNYLKAKEAFLLSLKFAKSVESLFQLALIEILQKEYSSADHYLKEARRLAPRVGTITAHLGVLRYLQGRYTEAKCLLQEALELNSSDEMAHFNLGLTFVALGRINEALVVFHKLHELSSSYPRLDAAIRQAHAERRPLRSESDND